MKTTRRTLWLKDSDGDMGIGTMIIFIAMVLVAAVAAALVINVAYNLQQQGQDTGDQAIDEIASGYNVIRVIGDRNNATGVAQNTIQYLDVYVKLHAGSPAMNLNGTIISITDGSSIGSLEYATAQSATQFNVTSITGAAVSSSMLTSGTIVILKVDASSVGLSLGTSTSCSMTITPKQGQPTVEKFTTPVAYIDRIIELV